MQAFLVSIAGIALGELGDKTQLLALILATQLRRPMAIILGILVATTANHLLAGVLGQWVGSLLSPQILRWILGISFMAVAIWVLVPDKADSTPRAADGYGAFMLTMTTFFLAEMGDKTQIVAMALAAKYHNLIAVVAGTTIGMMIVNVPTVLLANQVTRVVPLTWIRIAAALVYAALGMLTLTGRSWPGMG